ncbi:hypothetical protein BDY19DRAFT_750892 [Irpex rosettiformis]|uniref:Uncharacterized protein n=1 Tax=Irpex rosettiformis TaxID=378272 RepID=A0ACB8U756_9APHY|nr:hypothetical protein BDY19DRAFT_750892 [Irpex rosettiformis]
MARATHHLFLTICTVLLVSPSWLLVLFTGLRGVSYGLKCSGTNLYQEKRHYRMVLSSLCFRIGRFAEETSREKRIVKSRPDASKLNYRLRFSQSLAEIVCSPDTMLRSSATNIRFYSLHIDSPNE